MEENITTDKKSLKSVSGKSANYSELAKDCVAFANAQGGHLYIGIEDKEQLPSSTQTIPQDLPEQVVRHINELTSNVCVRYEVVKASNGGEYIDLTILQSRNSIASTTKGQYFVRDSDQSRPMMPEELSQLMIDKPSYCWETKVSLNIQWQHCDTKKLQQFIDDIHKSDRVSDFVKEKTDAELLTYYQMIDDDGLLTNLGVLWIGKPEQRARLLYSPIIQYIKYDEDENKVQKIVWDDYRFNPQELLEDIWDKIPDWKETYEVSDGLWRKEVPAFDKQVVREVICNALVHRPYTTRGDVFIKLYPYGMVVTNPGRLPLGVTVKNILQKSVKRNIHLAKVFYDLHLMEAEGSGYDLMYEKLLVSGKEQPHILEGDDFVEVTIPRKIIDKEVSKLLDYASQNYALTQKNRIALSLVARNQKLLSTELTILLQLQEGDRMRGYIDNLLNLGLLVSRGNKKGTAFLVNPTLITNAKMNVVTTLKTIEPHRLKSLVEEDLRLHPNSKLTEIISRLPDVDMKDLRKMVYAMCEEAALIPNGGKRNRTYQLAKKK